MVCAAGLVMRNLPPASGLCLQDNSPEAASPPCAVGQGAGGPPSCTHRSERALVPIPWGVGVAFALGPWHIAECCPHSACLWSLLCRTPPVAWALGSMGAPGRAGCLSGEPSSALTISVALLELEHILKESFQVNENLRGL